MLNTIKRVYLICPRCDRDKEDRIIIILYQSESIHHYREDILKELDMWLLSVNIIPDIKEFLVKGLKPYLSNQPSNICTQEYNYNT